MARAFCELCKEWDDDIANHLRLMHPDEYGDGFERWPDGNIVVEDETLEPGDFDEE